MNGLVDYASSDEDEEVDLPTPAVQPKQDHKPVDRHLLTNGVTREGLPDHVTSLSNNAYEENPVLGPSRPDSAQDDAQHSEYSELPDLPERDLLRYLTQPSHSSGLHPARENVMPADPALTARFKKFLDLRRQGLDFNTDLASKTSFRNPNLLHHLTNRAGISDNDQWMTALPRHVWSVDMFPAWSYKEEMEKFRRENEAQRKKASDRKVDFVPARSLNHSSSVT